LDDGYETPDAAASQAVDARVADDTPDSTNGDTAETATGAASDALGDSLQDAEVCEAGVASCVGKTLHRCDSTGKLTKNECAIGCVAGACLGVERLAVGAEHACVVLSNGTVRCWGRDHYGQLGAGTAAPGLVSNVPVAVVGITSAIDVAAGDTHTCARLSDKSLRCWGSDEEGELGADGGSVDVDVPVVVPGTYERVVLGYRATCGQRTDGRLVCWGLGRPFAESSSTPDETPTVSTSFSTVLSIASGNTRNSFCAQTAGGAWRCWGDNDAGQLADGTTSFRASPVDMAGAPQFISVAGPTAHGCGLLLLNQLRCWGRNDRGQVGDGTKTNRTSLTAVSGLSGASAVAVGQDHTCAITTTGAPRCWGANDSGQVGDGTLTERSTPVAVTGLSAIRMIGAGKAFTCAVTVDNDVFCWGANNSGQLGEGTSTDSATPVRVKF
jgi:alpha-tubulin suppressor-like RCC1 family protein